MKLGINILLITFIKIVAVISIFTGIALFSHKAYLMGIIIFFVGFSTLGISEVEDTL